MKIGLVTPYDYPYPGGVTEHIRHLERQFRALGHETRILAPSSLAAGALDPHVIKVNGQVTPFRFNGSMARISLSPGIDQDVQEILAKENFDIIHIHEPEVPLLSLITLVRAQAVTMGTFHAMVETSGLARYAYPLLMLPVLERLDGRIFVSKPLQDKVASYFPGQTRVIPNGIDYASYASPGIQPIPEFNDGRPNILFVGRMDERKGFRNLLRAYPHIKQRFPEVRLLVVEAYQPEEVVIFTRYARCYGLEDVHFIGKVSPEVLSRYYRTATVFSAPSTGSESFGIILLEAMAAGLPVVASDIAGYRSVLTHNQEGLLVEPENEMAIVGAITALLENPQMRSRIANTGRRTAQRYDWKVIAPHILDYYRELIEARSDQKHEPRTKGWALERSVPPASTGLLTQAFIIPVTVQTPTHLTTGVLIDQTVPDIKPDYVRGLAIAFLGVSSHMILDALAALTYHPPDPAPGDRFWLGYHAGIAALTLRVWKKNRQKHKWAMICSVLPDLDWLFLRIPGLFGNRTTVPQRPVLHELLFKTLYSLPIFKLLDRLPNLRQKKVAATLELTLLILMSGITQNLSGGRMNAKQVIMKKE